MVAMFLLAIIILWGVDRIRYRAQSPEEVERDRAHHAQKLGNPDWSFVAAEFGGEVPSAVLQLYSNKSLLRSENIPIDEHLEVAAFVPADDGAFDAEQWFNPAPDAFVVAVTPFGDPFSVRVSEADLGLPVYLYYHDGGDTEPVAPTLEAFVELVRGAARREDRI